MGDFGLLDLFQNNNLFFNLYFCSYLVGKLVFTSFLRTYYKHTYNKPGGMKSGCALGLFTTMKFT